VANLEVPGVAKGEECHVRSAAAETVSALADKRKRQTIMEAREA
jgi:hypothetical protein